MTDDEQAELRERIHEVIAKCNRDFDTTGFYNAEPMLDKIMQLIRADEIQVLERLLQYNGAYIGLGGKRVDNMVAHSVIESELQRLRQPNTADEAGGKDAGS